MCMPHVCNVEIQCVATPGLTNKPWFMPDTSIVNTMAASFWLWTASLNGAET
jgi:hypothetical protein